jgi:GTP-binding protein 1
VCIYKLSHLYPSPPSLPPSLPSPPLPPSFSLSPSGLARVDLERVQSGFDDEDAKTLAIVNVTDYLNNARIVKSIPIEEQIEPFEPEPDQGKMEYKLKLVNPTEHRIQHLTTQMNYRMHEGHGEAIYRIGVQDDGTATGLSEDEFRATLRTIARVAEALSCNASIYRIARGSCGLLAELVVRKKLADFTSIRVCIVGSVDAGKSTLVGVLTNGQLDNGRGSARMSVFRHRHEFQNGRTSSISRQLLGFDSKGTVLNYDTFQHEWEDIVEDSSKILTLIDLAGHERYFKTTVSGLTGQVPDYALVAVAANHGVRRMTKQHIGVSLALGVPIFVVVTKVDMCPPAVLQETLTQLKTILQSAELNKLAVHVDTNDDAMNCAANLCDRHVVPIFQLSCVSGNNVELLKTFLNQLPKSKDWRRKQKFPSVFVIEETYSVTGVGTVAGGLVLRGTVSQGEKLLLGPDSAGNFEMVQIKSIHVHRNLTKSATAGQQASLALRKVKRKTLRKGMVLAHPSRKPRAVRRFSASVMVLQGKNPIRINHQLIVHVLSVRQVARVVDIADMSAGRANKHRPRNNDAAQTAPPTPTIVPLTMSPSPPPISMPSGTLDMSAIDDSDCKSGSNGNGSSSGNGNGSGSGSGGVRLGTGARAVVTFEFVHHPEYLSAGSKLVFRSDSAKGIGRVVALHY